MNERKESERLAMAIRFIINHPDYIPLLKNKWRTDTVYEACLEEEPSIFRYIPKPSMRVIKKALELDGGNIQYIKKKIRKTLPAEYFLIAVDSNPREAIPYIPKKLISSQLAEELLVNEPNVLKDNNIDIIETTFVREQVEEDPSRIKYINNPSNELKCRALRKNPNVALYFDTLTEEMMDIIDELYPTLRESLPNYTRKIGEKANGSQKESSGDDPVEDEA